MIGVPSRVIIDNGTQFMSGAFTSYWEDFNINLCFASVVHPQSNG